MSRIGVNLAFFEDKINFGIGLFSVQLLREMVKIDSKNEYILFVTDKVYEYFCNEFKQDNVCIISLKSIYSKNSSISKLYRVFYLLPKFVRKYNLDCYINLSTVWYNFIPYNVKIINVVHDLHFIYYPKFYNYFMRNLIKYRIHKHILSSTKIVTISNYVKKDVANFVQCFPSENIEVIGNPVEIKNMKSCIKKEYILSVNSFAAWKNQITLVKGYHKILKENKDFPYKLLLIGYGNADNLRMYIQQCNLEGRVIIKQEVSDEEIVRYYASAVLFVNTSMFEGFGRGNIEASMMMLPVLTTDVMCMREVSFGLLNYYSPPDDYNALADGIKRLLSEEANEKKLLAIKSKFYSEYSPKNVAKKYIGLINNVI